MVNLKKVLGKKDDEPQDDTILFDLNPDKLQNEAESKPQKGGVQSFTVPAEPPQPATKPPVTEPAVQQTSTIHDTDSANATEAQPIAVSEQLNDLSSNLKNLVYDFRSFMSEAGSPFNPNEIPASPQQGVDLYRSAQQGYISANKGATGIAETETVEAPSDVERGLENRYISPADKMRLTKLLEPATKGSDSLKLISEVAKGHQTTKFAKELKSNLDSSDMPALIRAVNSTDYLLHAVGRKNLLKILEVGTREGWIRPEVERLVLSVAEVLSTAGVESDDRVINVNDLLRVVYFLNRLLDQEISDFLSMNPPLLKKP
jgi:archaellum component FlaD/FlaE